jgi:hypothetical protein
LAAVAQEPRNGIPEAMAEARMVMCGAVSDLLEKTGGRAGVGTQCRLVGSGRTADSHMRGPARGHLKQQRGWPWQAPSQSCRWVAAGSAASLYISIERRGPRWFHCRFVACFPLSL